MNPVVQLQIGHAQAAIDGMNPRIFVGRDPSFCRLVADHPSVSRHHCEVYVDAGKVFVRDMGSSNGTWINGAPVGQQPVAIAPGQQIYVGYMPLGVTWQGPGGGATVMAMQMPPELKALMDARKQQAMSQQSAVPGTVSQQMQVPGAPQGFTGGDHSGIPAHLSYRRQGANQNGCLLIALPGDTFSNGDTLEGFVEFTALDNETVDDITVELVECHKKGPGSGHVWDTIIVKQGPWKTARGDVAPMPFQLRIPSGTSISNRNCHWEVRGYVDIKWAYDVEASSEITMRNVDIEKVRDGLGLMDYRIAESESQPLGQKHRCVFQPPAQLQTQVGIRQVIVDLEYMGTNLKLHMEVDKKKRWVKDPRTDFVIDLNRFRATAPGEVGQHILGTINQLMA